MSNRGMRLSCVGAYLHRYSFPFALIILTTLTGLYGFGLHQAFGDCFPAWLAVDDAYITFRYSRHLAQGLGPVFNPGERVEGYSNFTWMVWSACGLMMGVSAPLWAMIGNTVCLVTTLFLVAMIARNIAHDSHNSLAGTLAPLLLASIPYFSQVVYQGLETGLVMLLFALAVHVALHCLSDQGIDWWIGLGLVLGALAMSRPEGAFHTLTFLGTLGALAVTDRSQTYLRRRWFVAIAAAVLPFGFYLLWRHSFYGAWMPNTYHVRREPLTLSLLLGGLRYLGESLWKLNGIFLLPLSILGILRTRGRNSAVVTLPVIAYLGLTVISGGDNPEFGPRWALYIWPAVISTAAVGLHSLFERRPLCLLVGTSLIVLSGLMVSYSPDHHTLCAFAEVADWLVKHAEREQVLATGAAGLIPYRTEMQVIDMLGLNDAYIARHGEINKAGWIAHRKSAASYVLAREPDYIADFVVCGDSDGAEGLCGGLGSYGPVIDKFCVRVFDVGQVYAVYECQWP